jgi:hypothetical protein
MGPAEALLLLPPLLLALSGQLNAADIPQNPTLVPRGVGLCGVSEKLASDFEGNLP